MFRLARFAGYIITLSNILFILQGCSASFPDYPVVTINDNPYTKQKDFIAVAISPVTQKDEAKKYFGVDMLSRNILPVQILVENRGDKASLILDREKIFLEGGESYDSNRMANKSGTGEVLATAGSVALVTGPLVAAPVGLLIGSKLTSDAQMVKQNMMAKRLDRHTLSPGTTEHGFVYFDITRHKDKYPDYATVRIELIELGSNGKHVIKLPFQWKE